MRKLCLLCMVVFFSGAGAQDARAEGEVSFVIGAGIGGSFEVLSDPELDLQASFKNNPLYGLRVGTVGFPIGFEGSLVYSPSALVGTAIEDELQADASILYTEANLLVIFLPGPVAPFVTGGLGLHYFDFNVANLLESSKSKFGWNWGGGLKINVEWVTFRLDLRDHITSFGLDDFGLGILGGVIGVADTSKQVHNVEMSFSVGIRF